MQKLPAVMCWRAGAWLPTRTWATSCSVHARPGCRCCGPAYLGMPADCRAGALAHHLPALAPSLHLPSPLYTFPLHTACAPRPAAPPPSRLAQLVAPRSACLAPCVMLRAARATIARPSAPLMALGAQLWFNRENSGHNLQAPTKCGNKKGKAGVTGGMAVCGSRTRALRSLYPSLLRPCSVLAPPFSPSLP